VQASAKKRRGRALVDAELHRHGKRIGAVMSAIEEGSITLLARTLMM
jgi:hypothetical protein